MIERIGVTEAQQSQQTEQHFNYSYFDTYTSGDEALQRDVILLFFGQVETLLDGLKVDGTGEDWFAAAHALKGGARGIGFERVASLCQQLEDQKDAPHHIREAGRGVLVEEIKGARSAVAAVYEGLFDA